MSDSETPKQPVPKRKVGFDPQATAAALKKDQFRPTMNRLSTMPAVLASNLEQMLNISSLPPPTRQRTSSDLIDDSEISEEEFISMAKDLQRDDVVECLRSLSVVYLNNTKSVDLSLCCL